MALPGNKTSLDLAVIGNCQVAGLLDPLGRLVWACLPRPDADPTFCSLLRSSGGDAELGTFAVELTGVVATAQHYRQNTAIVVTVLADGAGNELRVTDFCPRYRQRGRMHKPMMFVRILEPIQGRPGVRIRFTPANNYGDRKSVV